MDSTVGQLFEAAERGDEGARRTLFATLYDDLTRIARRELARHGSAVVGPSTIVHEVYIELSSRNGLSFPDKARFLTYAARAMRGIIIDHARRRCALKRGGAVQITAIRTEPGVEAVDHHELAQVDEALQELSEVEPLLAELVDLKFFCGLSFAEIAALRGTSERTIQRHWDKARIFLHSRLREGVID